MNGHPPFPSHCNQLKNLSDAAVSTQNNEIIQTFGKIESKVVDNVIFFLSSVIYLLLLPNTKHHSIGRRHKKATSSDANGFRQLARLDFHADVSISHLLKFGNQDVFS